jgi:hypothetical protein
MIKLQHHSCSFFITCCMQGYNYIFRKEEEFKPHFKELTRSFWDITSLHVAINLFINQDWKVPPLIFLQFLILPYSIFKIIINHLILDIAFWSVCCLDQKIGIMNDTSTHLLVKNWFLFLFQNVSKMPPKFSENLFIKLSIYNHNSNIA